MDYHGFPFTSWGGFRSFSIGQGGLVKSYDPAVRGSYRFIMSLRKTMLQNPESRVIFTNEGGMASVDNLHLAFAFVIQQVLPPCAIGLGRPCRAQGEQPAGATVVGLERADVK